MIIYYNDANNITKNAPSKTKKYNINSYFLTPTTIFVIENRQFFTFIRKLIVLIRNIFC